MPASPETVSLRLLGTSVEELRALFQSARSELAAGARRLHIDLEGLERLDSPVIACLITILREARQDGGDVALGATRPAILDTLRVTGLDKLFPREAAPEGAPPRSTPPPAKKKRALRRAVAGIAGLLVAFGGPSTAPASAALATQPDELVAHLAAQNPDMQSYQARLHVDFQLRTFPYIAQHLDGTAYFKRPDNYEVVFSNVPGYARGFDKLFADIGDPADWQRRFQISLAGERRLGGREDVVVRLVQRVRGMIDHEDVAVDTKTWRIDQMEWHYYNGGVISMTQDYQSVDGFNVLKAQHATIRIPYIHASAEGRYDSYHTNVAIDDSLFTRGRK
jgi:anti-anti-sigma factor